MLYTYIHLLWWNYYLSLIVKATMLKNFFQVVSTNLSAICGSERLERIDRTLNFKRVVARIGVWERLSSPRSTLRYVILLNKKKKN